MAPERSAFLSPWKQTKTRDFAVVLRHKNKANYPKKICFGGDGIVIEEKLACVYQLHCTKSIM